MDRGLPFQLTLDMGILLGTSAQEGRGVGCLRAGSYSARATVGPGALGTKPSPRRVQLLQTSMDSKTHAAPGAARARGLAAGLLVSAATTAVYRGCEASVRHPLHEVW